MTRTGGLLLALLAVLVLVWVVSPWRLPGNPVSERRSAAPLPAGAPGAGAPFELADVAERLQQRRSATVAADRAPLRNPFEFAETGPSGRATAAGADPAPAQPLVPSGPGPLATASTPTLIGVVERSVDGRRARVAVVRMSGRLYYVTVGDRVGSTYEVTTVDAEAVEVRDTNDGATRRLVLK